MKQVLEMIRKQRLKIFFAFGMFFMWEQFYWTDNNIVSIFQGMLNQGKIRLSNQNEIAARSLTTSHVTELRAAALKDRCSYYNKNLSLTSHYDRYFAEQVIVNTSLEMLFCCVPKVASTNFRRMLLQAYDVISDINTTSGYAVYHRYSPYLTNMTQYPNDDRPSMYRRYNTFLFVRDPLERLISGFHSKFFHPDIGNRYWFQRELKQFYDKHKWLPNSTIYQRDLEKYPLTFNEFVTYLIDMNDVGKALDAHFAPYYSLCRPCDVAYDYVGKYESLYNDTEYIFSRIGLHVQFPAKTDTYVSRKSETYVTDYFQHVPATFRLKLFNIFKMDYILFDYDVPEWLVSDVAVAV